jgi:poly(A) polymerase
VTSASERLADTLQLLSRLPPDGSFPVSLAALLHCFVNAEGAEAVCQRWRLSNKERDRVCWLVEHHAALDGAPTMRWSALQPLLVSEGIEDLLALTGAASPLGAEAAAFCRQKLTLPREVLDPPPLLTGDDLVAHGVPTGPMYKDLLDRIRAAQLDNELRTKVEAMALVKQWQH